ncbi:ribosomal protein S16 [Kwoniella shandongensis]|uniref:Ribosomal protein S16 n=1 Tax=Kwoniella shandongensis TaxID=1734106 RepID=A0A5M6C666_9TREE|nr:ribosomal protein S16 [Kwoniella shandongensis]KAA5530616.1 ribosomal protein S16 [Kwoniella shandongensis]
MPVRIRLARHGHRKSPVYHIVAINSKRPREGKPLELLGKYDPIPRVRIDDPVIGGGGIPPPAANVFGSDPSLVRKEKKIEWNVERIRWWLGVGAEPTRTVVKLLERGGVLTTPHKWQHPWSPAPQTTSSTSTAGSVETAAGETTGFAGKTAS